MSNQTAFETYLKNSDFFRDVMTTHRTAVALLFANLISELAADQKKQLTVRLARMHYDSPSIAGEYAQLTRVLDETIRRQPEASRPKISV